MLKPAVAILDRRVEVLDGSEEQKNQVRKVSDLRSLPFVVLLGEPGIGKSIVLELEAAQEGAEVLKVRALMTGSQSPSRTLFLDALDEYRADGSPEDKAYGLAQAISASHVDRWRITCRSEDWRKEADISPIQATTSGEPIVVAQILPLDLVEASAVLRSLGEPSPEVFLDRAEALGAIAFTENPLSLRLLCSAVADGGAWPSTRFALFESAIAQLGYEKNRDRSRIKRSSQPEILRAAAIASLYLLLSGARSIWRSNDEPPIRHDDKNAYLTSQDLLIENSLVKDLLDTAIFRGEGEAFEPMHRTVAEYLAAQALAQAVAGRVGQAAFPLGRALALITGSDGRPPTELRGVFAWFAVHLANQGDDAGASKLIEIDAATVLTYGDAGAFSTKARRSILANIGREDPFFRNSEIGITAVGGLAGEDLADDLSAVLLGPSDGTHRVLTVFEVLTSGPAVTSMRPLLREIALDEARPDWMRWRSADAWISGSESKKSARRELFEAVAGEEESAAKMALRLHLAAEAIDPPLTLAEIKGLLADYQTTPKKNSIGSLFWLQRKLEANPEPDLFEQPLSQWLPSNEHAGYKNEVSSLLDHALAASIRSNSNLRGETLWKWITNTQKHDWSEIGDDVSVAISEWLDARAQRQLELFEAVLTDDDPTDGAWVVINRYIRTIKRLPTPQLLRQMLNGAAAKSGGDLKRWLEVIVDAARSGYADTDTYWELVGYLEETSEYKHLLRRLTVWEVEPWRLSQYKSDLVNRRRNDRERNKIIRKLTPLIDEIRNGKRLGVLEWGAQSYFSSKSGQNSDIAGLQRVQELSNEEITLAIEQGWEHAIKHSFANIDAEKLGKAASEKKRYFAEFAVIAGLDRRFEANQAHDLDEIPIEIALCVLKSDWFISDTKKRSRLTHWAAQRLARQPADGAAQLLRMWNASLDADESELYGLDALVEHSSSTGVLEKALDSLLSDRPDLPSKSLTHALTVAAKYLPLKRIQDLTQLALISQTVGQPRRIWGYISTIINDKSEPVCSSRMVLRTFADVGETLATSFDLTEEIRIRRQKLTVKHLGPISPPSANFEGGWVNDRMRREGLVNTSINSLAASAHPSIGAILSKLAEDPLLIKWRFALRHARAQQQRISRDKSFVHPSHLAIRAALSGKEPVNAADLRAVAIEELCRLQAELHTGDNTPWKHYWSTDLTGSATIPRVENQCRDHLLDRLRDRLRQYRVNAALPEVRRGEETRADVILLSGAGWALPIEAKRHYHSDIWSAASTQLQGYMADSDSGGCGIYLVFWFGNDAHPTPARPDGKPGPVSAYELEQMLKADLPAHISGTTDVLVFDVSRPGVVTARKPRSRRLTRPKKT